ncbi:hypothetical protein DEIPH_ctg046orf0034 [Deinococcus phoenicis]|uniref:Copper amine oxidase-like N-terminal domain-containing protein n=1 Tax=Deinococcus phoenicis TaxID=1476583 RepID=A0A016QML5_9DEIO|nr:hypothetical protein [Deinococcus phoenicis]EYB67236.1 hypothetical protein DEIPH_ctg046orf0034 [Deinococcus phoenicis]
MSHLKVSYLKGHVLALLALALPTLAAAQSYSLVVNGQVAPAQAIVVKGQTYVPLSALQLLGIPSSLKGTTLTLGTGTPPATTPGGANQRTALEGCIGETLFNGVWRLTVRKVERIGAEAGHGPGWGVTIELRNGTATKTNLQDTGLEAIELVGADGNTFFFQERAAEEPLIYNTVTQAGGITYQLKFHVQDYRAPASSVPAAAKLVITLNPQKMTAGYLKEGHVAYTTPAPSFRVRLNCSR